MRKKWVLLQVLAVLIAVLQYGMRPAGQDEGRQLDGRLSSIFHPYLIARIPLAGSSINHWLVITGHMSRAHIRAHPRRDRRYRKMSLRMALSQLIGILHTCGNRTARAVWCYCSNMVYLYQLISKSVLFYALTECGGLVNEMLLMLSGDIESNPGPTTQLNPGDLRGLEVLLQVVAKQINTLNTANRMTYWKSSPRPSTHHCRLGRNFGVPSGLGRMVVGVILLLLILSGDIEVNPGPLGRKPTLPEVLNFTTGDEKVNLAIEIGTKYVQFGMLLLQDRNGSRVKNIAHECLNDPERINIEILKEWLTGRGRQPVTWATLVEVLRDIELSTLADSISAGNVSTDISTAFGDERRYLAACEQAIKAKGSLDQTAIHCVFTGMPQSGKSSLMHRLFGKHPSSTGVAEKRPSSTGVAEKPVRVEIRKSTVHVSGLLWCELEDLDDEATLLMCDASKIAPEGIAQSVLLTASLPVATQPGESFSLSKFLRNLFKRTPRTQKHQAASPDLQSSTQPQLPEEQGTKHPLEVFGDAFQKKWSKLKDLVDDHWTVYLTEIGGQPEFQELLPILVCGASVFFLVFRLDLDLNSRYQVDYINSSGESIVPYESSLTVQETLLQSLATVASTSITRMVGSETVHIIPRVFFVGTHEDRVSHQHLHEIDNTLQAVVKRTEAYRDGMVQFASESRLILPVNNLSESEEDVQQIQAAVERIGKQGDNYRVKTPFSWLMFSNVLQREKPPVLVFEQCFKLAQKCEINTRDEMFDALQFLHENVGVIRYYRDVPELREFIIKDLRYLFDVVTDLLAASFTFDRTDPSLHELFKRKGIFPLDVFEKLPNSTEFLPPSKLIALLQHLNIIALLREDGVSSQYFIPCVLAHSESSQPTPSSTTVSHVRPLLVTFENGYCPKGLFGSMAVYLLENKMKSRLQWGLEKDKIFRDQIFFSVGPYDSFQLTVRPSFLSVELCAFSGASTRRISLACVCSEVRQCISSCIREVCEALHYSRKAAHSFGFFCPEEVDANQSPHPATLILVHGKPCILKCPITHKWLDLPDDCLVWFSEDTSTVDRTAGTIAAGGSHLSLDVEDPPLSTDQAHPLPSQTSEQLSQAAARDRLLIQQHIEEQGSLKMNSHKLLLYGLPRTGKTTAMLRLSNQLQCLDPNDSPNPSTGFDKPRTVELQSIVIARGGGKVEWKHEDLEQQIETLFSRILKSSSNSSSSPAMASSSQSVSEKAHLEQQGHSLYSHTLKSSYSNMFPPVMNSSSQSDVSSSRVAEEQSSHTSKDEDVSPVRSSAVLELQAVFTSLVKAQDWKAVREKLKAIEDVTLLHMIDCGGHPECHEILPLLLEGRALSLLFLNLTHDLDKTYHIVFQGKEGPSSIEYESVFTAREVLQRILCSISSLQSGGAHKERPVALLVGSYLDKTDQEAVLTLDRSVQEALKSFIKKDVLFPANVNEGKYIATLDNMSDDQGDIEELRKVIFTIIKTRFEPERIPTAWLMLHLLLRAKYENEPGWCTVEECVEVATACGIKSEDLLGEHGILCYIHKNYGTLLYYPNITGLCEKVICDPNIILNTFTRTFLFSFACNPGHIETAKSIRATGEIPRDLMETISATQSADPIPTSEIIALLKDRYILYESVCTANGTRSYFMPCLLQPDPSVVEEASDPTTLSSINPAPLQLVPHSMGYVPLGLFPALVVKMSHTWDLKQGQRFRNRIQFKVRQEGKPARTVEFRQHSSYLELRLHKEIRREMDFRVLTTYRQQLWEAVHEVSSDYPHMKDVVWQFGFYCPGGLQPGGQPHSAVCRTTRAAPVDMECFHEPCCIEEDFLLENKHQSWFKVLDQGGGPDLTLPTGFELNELQTSAASSQPQSSSLDTTASFPGKRPLPSQAESLDLAKRSRMEPPKPNLKDLVKVKVKRWYNLGLQLDIEDDDLQTIKHDNPQDQEGCKRDMFRTWLRNCPQASYKQLVQALVESGDMRVADRLCRTYGIDMPQSR